MLILLYKVKRKVIFQTSKVISNIISRFLLYVNNVDHSTFETMWIPYISVSKNGSLKIGGRFKMNNNLIGNPIGGQQRCLLIVREAGRLTIGTNVGISGTSIVCHNSVTIKANVKIGGGVCIYDTDFHSLSAIERQDILKDFSNKKTKPINIEENVFIGAHSIILKGVTIGENSIVGAGSVVTKDIPPNQIWAGNPAKFIRGLDDL